MGYMIDLTYKIRKEYTTQKIASTTDFKSRKISLNNTTFVVLYPLGIEIQENINA